MNNSQKTRVLILGGGFGGLYAALHLDKTIAAEANVEVTLISRENFVLFTPMLHEIAAGDLEMTDIVSPLRQMLKHVSFLEADVEAIDLAQSRVTVTFGLRSEQKQKLKKPFAFTTLGQLASIDHRTGVANILGVQMSGAIAWWLWRTIYLAKLPRFERKLRVGMHWTLDLFFSRDFTQYLTVQGIDRVHRRLAYLRHHPLIPASGEAKA